MVLVHHVGRNSGKEYITPLVYLPSDAGDGAMYIFASKGGAPEHPAWYRNLVEHQLVELQDEASKGDYTVREASGDERAVWWQRAIEVWPDYATYQTKTDRQIPVLVLEPVN